MRCSVSVKQRVHIVRASMRHCIIKLMQQQFGLKLRHVSCCWCFCGCCYVCRRRTLSNYVLFYTYLLFSIYIFKFSYFQFDICSERMNKIKIKRACRGVASSAIISIAFCLQTNKQTKRRKIIPQFDVIFSIEMRTSHFDQNSIKYLCVCVLHYIIYPILKC